VLALHEVGEQLAVPFAASLHGKAIEVTAVLERLAVYQDLPHDEWPERKPCPLVEVLVDPGVLTWREAVKRSTFVGRARPPRKDGDAVPAGGESLEPDPEDVTASDDGPDLPPPGAGDHQPPDVAGSDNGLDHKRPVPTKVCKGCGLDKPLSEYGRHVHSADGLQGFCHSCKRLAGAAAHQPHPPRFAVANPVAQVDIPEVPPSAAVAEDVFTAKLQLQVAAWQTEWEAKSAEAEELNEVLNAGYRLLDALGAEPLLAEKT
jgi:hypothetical protein